MIEAKGKDDAMFRLIRQLKYKTTIEKIMEINDMKTNNIKGSEKIIIAKSIRIW